MCQKGKSEIMKLVIWKPAEESKPEPLRLRLVQGGPDIDLVICDAEGISMHSILYITEEGELRRFNKSGQGSPLPFPTDKEGRIKLGN